MREARCTFSNTIAILSFGLEKARLWFTMATMPVVGDILVPGDSLDNFKESEKPGKTILGPGLRRDGDAILATKAGIVRHREPNFYWIDSHQKRVRMRVTQ